MRTHRRPGRRPVRRRPEAAATHLVRIRLARDSVGQSGHAAGMPRRAPAREARHGEVGRTPEEMHWADLAYESGTKCLEDAIGLYQRTPESIDIFGVVGSVLFIVVETDRMFDFTRKRTNAQSNVEPV